MILQNKHCCVLQVLQEHLLLMKQPKTQVKRQAKKAGINVKALLLPLELRLVLQGAEVKFEHHPMEVGIACFHNML